MRKKRLVIYKEAGTSRARKRKKLNRMMRKKRVVMFL